MEKKSGKETKNILKNPSDYIRLAMVGNVDSGKSTLVGVLTKGLNDDGRGSARLKVFNYPHEVQNGRTSSIAQEIMGFTKEGEQIYAERFVQNKNKYWAEVVTRSSKVIAMIDLCGHEKYLKTTMLGMVGLIPDYCLIVVGANLGLSRMTKEHLGIALALDLPFLIVITKVDMVPKETLKRTITDLNKLLAASVVDKKPLLIDYDDENILKTKIDETNKNKGVEEAKLEKDLKNLKVNKTVKLSEKEEALIDKAAHLITSERICPIFRVSSVTNFGIPQLTRFLYKLESRNALNKNLGNKDAVVEFDIHDKFTVTGVGLVVSGLLKSGTIKENTPLLLGPNKTNEYKQVIVKTIHFNRVPVDEVYAGQFCCLALKPVKKKDDLDRHDLRKGIVLVDPTLVPKPCWGFEAEIAVLHHSSTIKTGYEAVMHCGVIRQSARIIKMNKDILRTGDKGLLTFQFMFNSEYLKPNLSFLLREGRTKVLGFITKVYNKLEDIPK